MPKIGVPKQTFNMERLAYSLHKCLETQFVISQVFTGLSERSLLREMQNSADEFSHFNFFSTLNFLALKLGTSQCRCEEVRDLGGLKPQLTSEL